MGVVIGRRGARGGEGRSRRVGHKRRWSVGAIDAAAGAGEAQH